MDSLARYLDGWDPVGPDDSCALVAQRFAAEAGALALAEQDLVEGREPQAQGLEARDLAGFIDLVLDQIDVRAGRSKIL